MAEARFTVDLRAGVARYTADLAEALGASRKTARQIGAAFDDVRGGAARLTGVFTSLKTAVAAAGVGLIVKDALDLGDAIGEMAHRLGLGVESLQALQHAATLAGASAEGFEAGIRTLNRRIGEAAAGEAGAAKFFAEIGLSVRDAGGAIRSTEAVLGDFAERITQTASPAEQTRLAMEAFGRSGTQLLPILREGREGLAGFTDAARRAGTLLSAETIKRLGDTKDAVDELAKVVRVTLAQAVDEVAPQLISVTRGLSRAFASEEFRGAVRAASQEIIAFAEGAAVTLAGLADTIAPILIGIGERLRSAWNIFAQLPPAAQTFGIFGVAAFGLKGAVAFALAATTVERIANTLEAIKRGVPLTELPTMGPEDIKRFLEQSERGFREGAVSTTFPPLRVPLVAELAPEGTIKRKVQDFLAEARKAFASGAKPGTSAGDALGLTGLGADQVKQLDSLRDRIMDLAIADPTARAIVKLREDLAALGAASPEVAAKLSPLASALEEMLTAQGVERKRAEDMAAWAEEIRAAMGEQHRFADAFEHDFGEGRGTIPGMILDAAEAQRGMADAFERTEWPTAKVFTGLHDALADAASQAALLGKDFDLTAARADAIRAAIQAAIPAFREMGIDPAQAENLRALVDQLRALEAQARQAALGKALADADLRARLFGDSLELVRARIEAVRESLVIVASEDLAHPALPGLKAQLAALEEQARAMERVKAIADDVAGAISGAFDDVARSITDAFVKGEASAINFGNIVKAMLADILTRMIQLSVTRPIADALSSGLSGALSGLFSGTGGNLGVGLGPAASGGAGTAFAEGGIVPARQGGLLARIGEAGRDEAVIPLPPAWRTWERDTAGGPQVVVNITNTAGAEVAVTGQRRRAGGGVDLDILVSRAVGQAVGSGAADAAMRTRFGVTPRVGGR